MQDWVAWEMGDIVTNSRRRWFRWMDLINFEDVLDLVAIEGCFRTGRMKRCGLVRKCFMWSLFFNCYDIPFPFDTV